MSIQIFNIKLLLNKITNKKLEFGFFIVLLCSSVFAGNKLNEKILFDFSNENQLKAWSTGGGAEISWHNEGSANPGSMLLKTPIYSTIDTKWSSASPIKLPKDWSDYDELQLDVYPESGLCTPFAIVVKSGKGNYFISPLLDWQGEWGTVRYKINRDKLDDTDIKSLSIYQSSPSAAYVLRIDNIKLVNTVQKKLVKLKTDYQGFGDKITADTIDILLTDIKEGSVSLSDARSKYHELKNKIREASLTFLRRESGKTYGTKDFAVALADSATRVLPHTKVVVGKVLNKFTVSLAQGEHEAIQPVIIATHDKQLDKVSINLSPLTLQRNSSIKFPEQYISSSPVGYVKTAATNRIVDYTGWYPDPILDFLKQVDVKAGETQPFWVKFFASKDVLPGVYVGSMQVTTSNAGNMMIPIEIKVRNFAIPKRGHLKFATSVNTHKNFLPLSQLDRFNTFVMDGYRINPFSIYSSSIYGTPKLPEIEDYQRLVPMGLNFIPLLYLKLPRQALHNTINKSKERWAAMSPEQQRHYPEDWKKKQIDILKKRVPELKKAGLYDIAYCYGFDEANVSEWPASVELCKEIKGLFPDMKIISTAGDSSYGQRSILGEALTGFIPLEATYNPKQAAEARKNGKEVWWYSTQMTIDADTLTEIRNMLGKNSFDNKVDGFLVWTVSRWNKNKKPITSGPYTGWDPESFPMSNGGGSYFCPGPDGTFLSTLRAEAIRDGMEDYEYLYLLRDLALKLKPNDPLFQVANKILNSPLTSDAANNRDYREQVGDLIEKILIQEKLKIGANE